MSVRHISSFGIAVMLLGIAPAYAAEHVYLRSGADLVCDHRKSVAGQVRLYLSPSAESYLDVAADDIVQTEVIVQAVPTVVEPARNLLHAAPSPDLPALLHDAGARHHIDPDLLASVVRAESGGRANAISRAGARGLMQLMPATASDLGVRDSFAAEQNIAGGTAYLDALLMYYHDNIALALAAYNAGPAAVARYHGIPPYAETRRYVQRIIHDYNRRKLLQTRLIPIPRSQLAAVNTENPGSTGELTTR